MKGGAKVSQGVAVLKDALGEVHELLPHLPHLRQPIEMNELPCVPFTEH